MTFMTVLVQIKNFTFKSSERKINHCRLHKILNKENDVQFLKNCRLNFCPIQQPKNKNKG